MTSDHPLAVGGTPGRAEEIEVVSGSRAGAGTVAFAAAVLGVGSALAALAAVAGTDAHRSQRLAVTSGRAASAEAPSPSPAVAPSVSADPSSSGSTLPVTATPAAGMSSRAAAGAYGASPAAGAPAAAVTAPSLSRSIVGPLHTSGNRIYDATNTPVLLVGVNRFGLQSNDTANFTPDDFGHARQWGANFIRLALGEQLWLSSSCNYDSGYVSKVDDAVSWITSRGMVALLDLHFNAVVPCGPAGQQKMADSPNSIDFWKQVAARYKSNPLVAFDLYNEPHGIPDSVWLNGGQVTDGGVIYNAAGMQQMYAAIRGQGATNLVFASGNDWGNNFPPLLSGYNVVYALHAYTCPQAPPPNCTNSDPYDPPSFMSAWVGPSQSVPVVLAEFGWPGTDDGRYNANMIAYAESHGWGWSAFFWNGRSNSQWSLVANVGPGAAYDPTPSGMPVFNALRGNH